MSRYGQTGRAMKDTGLTTKHKARESFGTLMETLTKENGMTIKPMAMVYTLMSTAHGTKDTGKMTFSMGKAKKCGPMAQGTKEITSREGSMAEEFTYGQMAAHTMESG